jgi:cyclopropane-fatty-acyl-phospholipid synthase
MPNTLTLVRKTSFYQDVVLRIMSRMDMGSMHLTLPDGERITLGNGKGNVSANVTINSNEFYRQVILYGDIGFGEGYVNGLWDTDNITNVIKWFLLNVEKNPGSGP